MKNQRVRMAMFECGVGQERLAKEFKLTQPDMSKLLNTFELAKKEQDELIKLIRSMKGDE